MCGIPGTSVADPSGEVAGRARGKERAARVAEEDGLSPVGKEKAKAKVPTR